MRQIIEVGLEIEDQETFDFIESVFFRAGIPYYFQPPHDPPWASIEDLECACEGK